MSPLVPPSVANGSGATTVDVILTPPAAAPVPLTPIDVSVIWDAGDTWRTSATVTVPFDLATWQLVKDFSAARITIDSGIVLPDGTVVDQPLTGPLVVRRSTVRRPEDVILLELASEASVVADLNFTADTGVYSGADAAEQIRGLILAALPGAVFNQSATGVKLNAESTAGSDRWTAVETVADYANLEVWQDTDARFVIRTQPVQLSTPVDTLMVGQGGNITESSSDFNRDTFANAYAVRAVFTDPNGNSEVAYGIAYDDDPASATRWDGPAGNRVRVDIESERLTNAECLAIAQRRLARSLGHGRGVRLTCPIRPWLRPGDPVAVELPTGGVQLQTVQRVEHSFPAMTTTLDTRLLPADAYPPTALALPRPV